MSPRWISNIRRPRDLPFSFSAVQLTMIGPAVESILLLSYVVIFEILNDSNHRITVTETLWSMVALVLTAAKKQPQTMH